MLTTPGDFVVLYNDGDTDFKYRYQFRWYTIPAHGKQMVPWGHFTLLCGDPFITNADRNMDRNREWERLRTRYGRDKTSEQFPPLRAEDPDGDPILGIIHDRFGEHAPSASPIDDPMDPVALRAQLDAMARRQQALEQLLEEEIRKGGQAPAPTDLAPVVKPDPSTGPSVISDIVEQPAADVPEDTPNKPPVKKAAARK